MAVRRNMPTMPEAHMTHMAPTRRATLRASLQALALAPPRHAVLRKEAPAVEDKGAPFPARRADLASGRIAFVMARYSVCDYIHDFTRL